MEIRVVLVEPLREGNVGGVARAMKNFGLTQLYLVNLKMKISDEARAYACHAVDILERMRIVESFDEAVKDVNYIVGTTAIVSKSSSNLRRITIFPEELAKSLVKAPRGTIALLFGREDRGLLNEEIEKCDVVVTIPSSSAYPVLNVVTAAAIIFYELFKYLKVRNKVSFAKPADRRVIEVLLKHFEDLMKSSGIYESRLDLTMKAFKNLLGRSFLYQREATLMAGAFRMALLKLRSS